MDGGILFDKFSLFISSFPLLYLGFLHLTTQLISVHVTWMRDG